VDRDPGGYRITNEHLFQAIDRLRVEVGDVKSEVALIRQRQVDGAGEMDKLENRVRRLEARLANLALGVGIGIAVGMFYIWQSGAL
jgi:hypothetical protein